jgi:hypothetical protein
VQLHRHALQDGVRAVGEVQVVDREFFSHAA